MPSEEAHMWKYAKTIVATVIAVAYAVQAALSDEAISSSEWVGIGLAALTALGVWAVPNKPVEPSA